MFTYLCNKFSFLKEIKIFISFFDKAPSLYFSLFALFGTLYGQTSEPIFFLPLLPLLFHRTGYLLSGIALFFLFFISAPENLSPDTFQGTGIFTLREVQEQKGYLMLKGKLHHWNGKAINIPAFAKIKKSEEAHLAFHQRFFFQGSLKQKNVLEIFPKTLEPASPSPYSLVWHRFYMKKKLLAYMTEIHPNGPILSSLLFGTPVPKQIATSIKRFGLSHLFAISGFHFNLITTLLALLIRPLVSYRIFHWAILLTLTLYALLIGPNPSLLRGFLAQAILFLGLALQKNAIGLNSLGAALLFITLFFPDLTTNLGFIFSFLITFALLLLYPLVSRLFPQKPAFLMAPLSLLATVELVSLPLNLTLFGTYPVLSPLYNLFVTPLISFSLFFAPLALIPYLCHLIYVPLNIALWTFDVPSSVDLFLHVGFSPRLLTLYLTLLFTLGISLSLKKA